MCSTQRKLDEVRLFATEQLPLLSQNFKGNTESSKHIWVHSSNKSNNTQQQRWYTNGTRSFEKGLWSSCSTHASLSNISHHISGLLTASILLFLAFLCYNPPSTSSKVNNEMNYYKLCYKFCFTYVFIYLRGPFKQEVKVQELTMQHWLPWMRQ